MTIEYDRSSTYRCKTCYKGYIMDKGICKLYNKANYSVTPGADDEQIVSHTSEITTIETKPICIDRWYTEIKTGEANINKCVVCTTGSN